MSLAGHRMLRAMVVLLTTTLMTLMTSMMTASMLGVIRSVPAMEFRYHNHAQMGRLLKQLASKYPTLARLYSTGKSYQGRELWVLVIGKHNMDDTPLIPNVKYIANMHGNEVVGRQLLLHLANYFLKQYNGNATIQTFLDTTNVHLMPTMNPDGYSASAVNDCMSVHGRGNIYRYDLNRNFPDPYVTSKYAIQQETAHVMKWIRKHRFVLSANLHGGAEVVNYPWDSLNGDMTRVQYAVTPDDDVFRHLSLIYSRTHPTMHLGSACGDYFQDGITNGANWYPITGGMADYMYRQASGYELLIEMSCCKYPDPSTLPLFWNINKDALINLLFAVHMGVKGIVSIQNDTHPGHLIAVPDAVVVIGGREKVKFHTTAKGEYYKLLLPGDYVLKVLKPGYKMEEVPFTVYDGNVTILHVQLKQPPSNKISLVSTVGHTLNLTTTMPKTTTTTTTMATTAVTDVHKHVTSPTKNHTAKTAVHISSTANSELSVNPSSISQGTLEDHGKTKRVTPSTTQELTSVSDKVTVSKNTPLSVNTAHPYKKPDRYGVMRPRPEPVGNKTIVVMTTPVVNDGGFRGPDKTVTDEKNETVWKETFKRPPNDVRIPITLDKNLSTSGTITVNGISTPVTNVSNVRLRQDSNVNKTDQGRQVMGLENGAFHSSQNLATGSYTFILILTSLLLS